MIMKGSAASNRCLLCYLPFYIMPTAGNRAGQVGEWSDQWKVLVYDKPCRNIISTLMHVTQLRKQGVTLHMLVSNHWGDCEWGCGRFYVFW